MTLASLTALMSKVGRTNPSLSGDRNVTLFIQACIEEARKLPNEVHPRSGNCSERATTDDLLFIGEVGLQIADESQDEAAA